jgi:hypothetical protein
VAGEGLDGGEVGTGLEEVGDEAAAQVVGREAGNTNTAL